MPTIVGKIGTGMTFVWARLSLGREIFGERILFVTRDSRVLDGAAIQKWGVNLFKILFQKWRL